MTAVNTRPIITRRHMERARGGALVRYGVDRRWLNALEAASAELARGAWVWYAGVEILKIESRSRRGARRFYHVSARGCSPLCEAASAGRVCWHAAAWQIVKRAQEQAARAPQVRDAAREAARQAEADELFN